VTWLNRGTLHLVSAEDFWWLHPLTAPRMASGIGHRLRQLGVSASQAERGVDTIVAALEADGPLPRGALRLRLIAEGVPAEGQALVHLLATASLRGLIVRGPVRDGTHAFVAVGYWLGAPPTSIDRTEALGHLAVRYLEGHEPAGPDDLAKWAGITLSDARVAFDQRAGELRSIEGGFVRSASDVDDAPLPTPRLLGPFDPILHGWSSRELWVGVHQGVVTTNGIFRPVGLVDGRVVATWRLPDGRVEIDLLEDLNEDAIASLVADARDVGRFLGRDGASPQAIVRPAVR